jgi:predicted anti-sigma-YlaC factor YlaD
MNIESRLSGHWTDDELIEHLYGVGPSDAHLNVCRKCQARLSAAQSVRRTLEADLGKSDAEMASHDFLMSQRRRIYARLSRPPNRWAGISIGRWAPAAATLLVVAGGLVVYDQRSRHDVGNRPLSDVQLARDVSCMAADSEPRSTAPLRALFEE